MLACLTSLFWFSLQVGAEKVFYPPQRISAAGLERLEITGVRGRLRLTGARASFHQLRVGHSRSQSEDWNLLVERRGKVLVLEVSHLTHGREWRRHIEREKWPEFDLELRGPPLPATVGWREGQISCEGWTADLEASLLDGPMRISGGRGRYRLQVVNSDLDVGDFRGELRVQGENGAVRLKKVNANVDLTWLAGRLFADATDGRVRIDAREIKAQLRGVRGEWEVKTGAGEVAVRDFRGRFKGRGESAVWSLANGTGELELTSATGSVDIRNWPKPAKVFLSSARGDIRSPYPIEDRDGSKVSEGKGGRPSLAGVFVRTESGAIRFRF